MQGQRIAHFEIREELGAGAMGIVYRARDTVLGRDVALKLIRSELAESARARNRFLQECRTAASVNHPGIATIYEAGEADDGQLYLATELVDGESLEHHLERGTLPADRVIRLGIDLGRALAAAHRHGIVHRDIKPANLMIQSDGSVKVLDFGLARLKAAEDEQADSSEAVTQTRVGIVVGTPAYMAPEQAAGGLVDERADIFACGSVLYAAASGRAAFKSGSIAETLRRILVEEPEPLESLDSAIPSALSGVIQRAMSKEPDARYASADQLAEALEAVRRGESVELPRSSSARARKRRMVGGATVVVLLLAALAGWWLTRPTLSFTSRDRLLVADVDNFTGDEAFDLALRTALEADLQQSRWAIVFDQNQVLETLRLMRRPPDTRIDEQVGRDICRFAGVRALLLPRILAVGDAYELQAILVDPASGSHVDRVRVTARGREQVLLEGIDELTRQVRKSVGESLESIQQSDAPVARVTTSSWDALNFFSMGSARWREANYEDAATMFDLALAKDPEFVSAKGSLALLLMQFLGEPERGRQLLTEARDASADLPERERLMIEAVTVQFVERDYDKALEKYHLISEIYPGMMQPYNNSGRILFALGRYEEAEEMYEKAHQAGPRSSVPLSNLYWVRLNYLRDLPGAEDAARRMVELGPTAANFRSMLAWSLITQARFEEALDELKRVLDDEPRHPYALPNMGHTLYALRRSDEAIPFYRRQHDQFSAGDQPIRWIAARDLAMALLDAGQRAEATELIATELGRLGVHETSGPSTQTFLRAQLQVLAGDTDPPRRLAEEVERSALAADARLSLAQLYALLGDEERAVAELAAALEGGYQDPYFPKVMPPFRELQDYAPFLALFE